jgi:probable rRNA maturation factor
MALIITKRQKKISLDLRKVKPNLRKATALLNCEGREISLTLVDDDEITAINSQYLHRNRPTNVISFSMGEGDWTNIQPDLLGDIVISVETAMRDAQSENMSIEDEILFLFIHGLLHLLGYDHENGITEDAARMKAKEEEIFFAVRHYHVDHD